MVMVTSQGLKRPRNSPPPLDYDDVVSELNSAVTSVQRQSAVQHLFAKVGYDAGNRRYSGHHEYLGVLIEAGVAHSLCLQLGYVMNKGASEDDLKALCSAIDLIFHSSRSIRDPALKDLGSDLIPLLLRGFGLTTEGSTVHEIISIWHSCSGSTLGSTMLLKCPGLLSALVNILLDESERARFASVRQEALGVIKNLAYYAEDQRLNILSHPGMSSSLSRIPFSETSEKSLERLSSILRNLAIAPNARNVMARQQNLLNAMIRMSSNTNTRIVRNTLSTIITLTMEGDACIVLVMHGEGILLNVLARLIAEDGDLVVRRRAARALRFLARDKGAPFIMGDTHLMHALSCSALSDQSSEVRLEASEAFATCAASVQAQMPHHSEVLNTLKNLATSCPGVPALVARALKEQAGCRENRIPMANHDGLLQALSNIALNSMSSATTKEHVTCALRDLSSEESNTDKMATAEVLEALVKNTNEPNLDGQPTRMYAVSALLNIASRDANRKNMVMHEGLLNALVQFAATTTDPEIKSAVKKVILKLVPAL